MAEDNKKLQEAKKLLQDINALRAKLNQDPLNLTDQEAVNQIERLRNELKGAQKGFEDVADSATSLYDQIRAISTEFKNQPSALQKIRGSMRKITSIAEDLKMNEQGIRDLSLKQLDDLSEKLKLNKKVLDDESERLLNGEDLSEAAQKEVKAIQDLIKEQGGLSKLNTDQVNAALELVNTMNTLSAEQKAALSNYIDQGNAIGDINSRLEAQKEEQRQINKTMGVGGAVVSGIDGVMSKLGINSGIFKQRLEEANEAMEQEAKTGTKLSTLMAGLGPLAKGFGEALLDPASIMLKIVDAFFKVDKASTEVQRLTGQNADAIAGANFRYADSVDYLNTIAELTQQTGMNAQNIFSPDVIAGAAELKNTMGLAADEAGGLAMLAQTTNGDIDATVESIVDQTSAFNKANRSAVNQKQVLQDVAKASAGIKASLGGNPALIAKAASAARRLGMELSDVDQIAGSLLDFEDSISKELEAELLIGKDLNLNKARELALANDLEGVGKELFKNAADVNEFGRMNRIQQEAYAASLGMTRDQLAKIAYQKAIEAGMTAEQAEAAAGVKKEDMERAAVQEQIQKSLDKLAQAFAPLLSIIGDIVGILAPIVQIIGGAVGYVVKFLDTLNLIKPLAIGIVAILAAGKIASFFGSATAGALKFAESLKGMKFSFTGMIDSVKEWGSSIKDAFKSGMSGAGKLTETITAAPAAATDLPETVTGGLDKTIDATDSVVDVEEPKSSGEKLKEFFTNLAAGLKEMASMKVVGGALALIPASVGLVAFIPGYLGAKLMEGLNGPKLQEGLMGLAQGLTQMGSMKVLLGAAALVATAFGFAALLAGIPAMTFLAFGGTAVASGLTALTGALIELGIAGSEPLLWIGIGALAAIGVTAMEFGFALSLAAPAISAFGDVILKVFEGLSTLVTATANAFILLMDSMSIEKLGLMMALGPAMFSAAAGIAAFGAALAFASVGTGISLLTGGGIFTQLALLSAMAEPLSSVAGSLSAIALALTGIGTALATIETEKLDELQGLVLTTAFAAPAVAAAGAIGDMIAGIAGGGKEEGDAQLLAKMDELIAAVKARGDVKIDGRKVGESLALSASNTR